MTPRVSGMDRELRARDRWGERLRRWRGALLLVALALVALGALRVGFRPTLDLERVRTARVERGAVEAVIAATGIVRSANEHVLSSPIDGRVLRVLLRPGVLLQVGDPILELDVTSSRLAVERLEGEIAQVEGRRRQLEAEIEELVSNASSRLEIQQLVVEQLEYRVAQQRRLQSEGLLSEGALKEVETELRKAQIELRGAEEAVGRSRRSSEARGAEIGAELSVLNSERQAEEERLRRSSTRADQSGVLTWVISEEGAAVRQGDVLARIADLEHFRVEATVSDIHSDRLSAGLPVQVVLGAGRRLEGVIERVDPAVDQGTQRFSVALSGPPDSALRPNLRVDAYVVIDRLADVLRVAKGPFANGTGSQPVFVVNGQVAERRAVVLGLSGIEAYEVVSGLVEGEEVIVSDMRDYSHLERIALR
jgi:HlyD family secretion protein